MRVAAGIGIGATLAAGLAGTGVTLAARGGEAAFLHEQQHPRRLEAAAVERVVRTAPDPARGTGAGDSARCRPTGERGLRNPWTCTVRYASGRRARLTVEVLVDGSYLGRYAGGGAAEGCCVAVPGRG